MLMMSCKLRGLLLTCCVVVQTNNLQMIVRAHECVMDGFERFAQGHLITLFSATNYCGTANNAGGSFCVIHCGCLICMRSCVSLSGADQCFLVFVVTAINCTSFCTLTCTGT